MKILAYISFTFRKWCKVARFDAGLCQHIRSSMYLGTYLITSVVRVNFARVTVTTEYFVLGTWPCVPW